MYISKVLCTSLDLGNEIFNKNTIDLINLKLHQLFLNKCYKSILIKKIVKVIRHSNVIFHENLLEANAFVDVEFEVEGIILIKSEILNKCEIIQIHGNAFTAENQYCSIKIETNNDSSITNVINVGDIIPVVVKDFIYSINSEKISVLGNVFLPKKQRKIYFIINKDLTQEEIIKLQNKEKMINEEELKHNKINKSKYYKTFVNLMYPYKSKQNYKKNTICKKLKMKQTKLLDYKNIIKDLVLVYPDEEHKLNKVFYIGKFNKELMDKVNKVDIVEYVSAYVSASYMLDNYLIYLTGLRGMAETYDIKLMNKTMAYMKLCQNIKT